DRRVGTSKWSRCACESSTASGTGTTAGSGTVRCRCAMRFRRTGSVRTHVPSTSTTVVLWPSHVSRTVGGGGATAPSCASAHRSPSRCVEDLRLLLVELGLREDPLILQLAELLELLHRLGCQAGCPLVRRRVVVRRLVLAARAPLPEGVGAAADHGGPR